MPKNDNFENILVTMATSFRDSSKILYALTLPWYVLPLCQVWMKLKKYLLKYKGICDFSLLSQNYGLVAMATAISQNWPRYNIKYYPFLKL